MTTVDERSSTAHRALFDDRGIGAGPAKNESRLSLGAPEGGRLGFDHMNEVLSSFRSCIMKAVPRANGKFTGCEKYILCWSQLELPVSGTWKLEYDSIAAHALLLVIKDNSKAFAAATIGMDRRCRQAAAFLSDIPQTVADFDLEYIRQATELPAPTNQKESDLFLGTIMDMMFRGKHGDMDQPCVLSDLLEIKTVHGLEDLHRHSIDVALCGSYTTLCDRCCVFPAVDDSQTGSSLLTAVESAVAWIRLGMYGKYFFYE